MPTSVSWNGSSRSIPNAGELSWQALTGFLVDLGNNAQTTNFQKVGMRVATSSPVTVAAASDCVVVTNLGVAGAVAVNLPAGVTGQMFCIVDGKGDAATNNITITPAAGNINGAATYAINGNRNGIIIAYNGTEWTILSEFLASGTAGSIPRDQLAAGTAGHVIINDGSGVLSSEAQLAITRGGTGAATAPAGFDALAPTTTRGDLVTRNASSNVSLGIGAASTVLKSDGTDPAWAKIVDANVDAAAAIARSKVAAGTASHVVTNDGSGVLSSEAQLAPVRGGTGQDFSASTGVIKVSAGTVSAGTVGLGGADVSGTLPIGNGGTGQTTQTAAFDALAPTTTKGDIVVHDGTDNLRLPVGTNNQVLTADSTQATGVKWADGGAGSGSGEINVVTNPSAASATTGWTAGTSHTVARITSGSPLDPTVATALELSASAAATESSTSGVYWSVATMPAALLSKKLKVEFYVTIPASDVWRLSVYQGATRLALSTDSSSVTTLPAGFTGKFTAYFDTTTATAYSINFTKTTHSGANNLKITSVVVGPGIQPQGAVVTEWQNYAFTTNASNNTLTAYGHRVGGNLRADVTLAFSGNGGASASFGVALPSGYTADTARIPAVREYFAGYWYDVSAASVKNIAGYVADATTIRFTIEGSASTLDRNSLDSSDKLSFSLDIPIAEWSGSGTLNVAQNDVEYAWNSDTTNSDTLSSGFSYGPAGAGLGSYTGIKQKRVRFASPIQVTDSLILEVQKFIDPTNPWVAIENATYDNGLCALQYQNGVAYGIGFSQLDNTDARDITVVFGDYGYANSTYGAAGVAWSSLAATYKWRVRKVSGGAAVGFGLADTNSSGLVKKAKVWHKSDPTSRNSQTTNAAYGAGNLDISGLTVGKTYRASVSALCQFQTGANVAQVIRWYDGGSANSGNSRAEVYTAADWTLTEWIIQTSGVFVFTATTSTLHATWKGSNSASLYMRGDIAPTTIVVEEIGEISTPQ